MAPIERKYKKQSSENTKQQSYMAKQESKKRPQAKAGFMYVPTITRRQNPINFRQHVIENCTLTLNHACNCSNVNCPVDHCGSMKRVWKHVLSCNKSPENCQVCKNFQTLVAYHSRLCLNTSCNVVFCSAISKRRQSRSQLLLNGNHREKQ